MLFADQEGADRAVRELNGTEMDGRKIFLRKVWFPFVEDLTFGPLSLLLVSFPVFFLFIWECLEAVECIG